MYGNDVISTLKLVVKSNISIIQENIRVNYCTDIEYRREILSS